MSSTARQKNTPPSDAKSKSEGPKTAQGEPPPPPSLCALARAAPARSLARAAQLQNYRADPHQPSRFRFFRSGIEEEEEEEEEEETKEECEREGDGLKSLSPQSAASRFRFSLPSPGMNEPIKGITGLAAQGPSHKPALRSRWAFDSSGALG